MNWLQALLRGRDERDRKDRELTQLEARSEDAVRRADHALREQKALTEAVRNTVRALRAESHRR